jgi:hypothetical protein
VCCAVIRDRVVQAGQLILITLCGLWLAGVLQWISNVLAEGVKLWDRVYGEDIPSSRSGRDEPAPQL